MKSEDIKSYVANFKNYIDNLSDDELQKYIDYWKEQSKNMKSARELFEQLGYTYQESYFEEKLDEINFLKVEIMHHK